MVALVLPSSPSLILASQTLSGWLAGLPSLGPFHEIEGAAAHAQNLVRSETKSKVRPKQNFHSPVCWSLLFEPRAFVLANLEVAVEFAEDASIVLAIVRRSVGRYEYLFSFLSEAIK